MLDVEKQLVVDLPLRSKNKSVIKCVWFYNDISLDICCFPGLTAVVPWYVNGSAPYLICTFDRCRLCHCGTKSVKKSVMHNVFKTASDHLKGNP